MKCKYFDENSGKCVKKRYNQNLKSKNCKYSIEDCPFLNEIKFEKRAKK